MTSVGVDRDGARPDGFASTPHPGRVIVGSSDTLRRRPDEPKRLGLTPVMVLATPRRAREGSGIGHVIASAWAGERPAASL